MIFKQKTHKETHIPKGYHYLTCIQRSQIAILKERGDSLTKIAKALNVHHSTIGREWSRNSGEHGYNYQQAQEKAVANRPFQANKKMTSPLIALIEEKLRLQWSPVQISGWLKLKKNLNISHETIYKHIRNDKRGFLYENFRHRGKKYNKRNKGIAGRGCIIGRVDIDQRPSIVEEKRRLGDWG